MATLWNPNTAPHAEARATLVLSVPLRHWRRYNDRRLSDMTLGWIQQKASALGLALDAVQVGPKNYFGEFTDSYAQFLGAFTPGRIRGIIARIAIDKVGNEVIDDSVQHGAKKMRLRAADNGLPKLS